jgi:hypothetical protein
VAQNHTNRRSAIDGRTTRHPRYALSQIKRKRVEEIFGWGKTIGLSPGQGSSRSEQRGNNGGVLLQQATGQVVASSSRRRLSLPSP